LNDEPEVTVRATRADRRRRMAIATYTLEQFIRDLCRITTEASDPRAIIRVRPLARRPDRSTTCSTRTT
jgi:hypothetical protein